MTVIETALVFGAIPLGIIALIAFAVYGRSALHQPNRYRPGRPWPYRSEWYVPHPEAVPGQDIGRRAIEGEGPATVAAGGASGEW
jgi:hypothetical protein